MRKDWKQKRGAVILLQAHTRGMLDRRVVGKMRKDVRAETGNTFINVNT